jgi:N-acetylated-alpha-linked acidic dipeptidase
VQNTCSLQGDNVIMRRFLIVAVVAGSLLSLAKSVTTADEPTLTGFSADASRAERQWEEKFKAIPSPRLMRDYMQRLAARPHNVGTPYDKDNAEWLLGKFKEFGLDAHIETFDVLFPTPEERAVELVEGGPKFAAKLQEPVVREDPTSNFQPTTLIRLTAM